MSSTMNVLFMCSVILMVPTPSSARKTDCFGDVCNMIIKNQFCSTYFQMCRNCADIRMECGTERQPIECNSYCIAYMAKLEVQKQKDSNCTALDPVVNGVVNTSQSEYQQGDVIQIKCIDGYEPHYPNTAQCHEFGIIRYKPFTCIIKTCTVPTILSNGFINPLANADGRYTINTTITFTCKQRYTLIGASTMKCLGNNRRSETVTPFCLSNNYMYEFALKKIHEETANSCSVPAKLANGYIKPNPNKDGRFHIGTRVTFSCEKGYTLIGAQTMACKGNDTWTEDEFAFCLENWYIVWRDIGISLAVFSTALLIATFIILAAIGLKHKHRKNQKKTKATHSLNTHNSSTESGIELSDESCPLMTGKDATKIRRTMTEDKGVWTDNELTEPFSSKRANDSIPSTGIVLNMQDNNPNVSPVNVININNYINKEHTTDHTKLDDSNDDVSRRELKSEEKNESSPTEESQVTIEASQESQGKVSKKGTEPLHEQDGEARNSLNNETVMGAKSGMIGLNDKTFSTADILF